jgi:hypothetical protein
VPRRHVVEPGECLASIAAGAGLPGPQTLLDHPANQQLRERLRENPNLVPVGEEVEIPDPVRHNAPARSRTRIVLPAPDQLRLRLLIQDGEGKPAADRKWQLKVGAQSAEGRLAPTDEEGKLLVWMQGDDAEPTELLLDLGMLEPADTIRGAQARLMNLGFYDGPLHGDEDDATREALRAFQEAHDLPPTAALDDDTQRTLAELHDGAP